MKLGKNCYFIPLDTIKSPSIFQVTRVTVAVSLMWVQFSFQDLIAEMSAFSFLASIILIARRVVSSVARGSLDMNQSKYYFASFYLQLNLS